MVRKIIKIDEEKCTGCGLCASACHENAIVMENEKAHLLRDDFCDGFGDCLPACPAGAITIEERESAEYNPAAVEMRKQILAQPLRNELMQWPVQIKLLPVQAPFYENANLLIAADCTAYAYAAFHRDFIKNHITLVGCPKLDEGDYTEKLTAIISQNNIKSLTIVRMEVPCCGGLERAATEALKASGKFIPWRVVVISRDGEILE